MGVAELLSAFRDNEDGPDLDDVLEELVAGLLEGRGLGGAGIAARPGISLLFGHVVG